MKLELSDFFNDKNSKKNIDLILNDSFLLFLLNDLK